MMEALTKSLLQLLTKKSNFLSNNLASKNHPIQILELGDQALLLVSIKQTMMNVVIDSHNNSNNLSYHRNRKNLSRY
jgi:hypothetical protein